MFKRLTQSWTKATSLAAVVTLFGGGAIWAGNAAFEGTAEQVVTDLASAVFTAGLLGLLYDMALRRTVTTEILDHVGLKERLVAAGLTDIASSAPDWSAGFVQAERAQLLPTDPITWISNEWRHVVDRASRHRLDVDLYLPRPHGTHVDVLASRLGRASAGLPADLNRIQTAVQDTWTSGDVVSGSELRVHHYGTLPANGVFVVDRIARVLPASGPQASLVGPMLLLEFDLQQSPLYEPWITAQFSAVTAVPVTPVVAP